MRHSANPVSFKILLCFFRPCRCLPENHRRCHPCPCTRRARPPRRAALRLLQRHPEKRSHQHSCRKSGRCHTSEMHELRILPICCQPGRCRDKIRAMWRFRDTDYCTGKVPSETKISSFYSGSHLHLYVYSILLSTSGTSLLCQGFPWLLLSRLLLPQPFVLLFADLAPLETWTWKSAGYRSPT